MQVGTTVAVLTSVAMIPGIHEAYVFNFFSRLLTALIGLVTAGLVNFMILPPKYYNQLEDHLYDSEEKCTHYLINDVMNCYLVDFSLIKVIKDYSNQ